MLKFVIGCIPSFDAKISAMKNKVDKTQSNSRWEFSTSVPFKTFITQHQDKFPSRHTAKKNDTGSSQEGKSESISCWIYGTFLDE